MTLTPVLSVSRHDRSIYKNCPSGLSVFCLTSLAVSSLSLATGAMVLKNSTGSIHLVCSVSEVASMCYSAVSALASLCPRPSRRALLSLVNASSFSNGFPGCVCSSPSCRVTGRMSLINCLLDAARGLRPHLHCLLFSSHFKYTYEIKTLSKL